MLALVSTDGTTSCVDCGAPGETLLRKLGRAETLRKQSVPEIVFAYFHNKYGQKNVVNEYVVCFLLFALKWVKSRASI